MLPRFTEERPFQCFNIYANPPSKFQTITLKGRLEYRKDYKAILYAASQTPGIVALNYENFAVEITWLSKGAELGEEVVDFWEDAERHISTFVQLVKDAPKLKQFIDLGIETHVFWQSLKPINQYDGERNGIWAIV